MNPVLQMRLETVKDLLDRGDWLPMSTHTDTH
jgi:hypothetical protein